MNHRDEINLAVAQIESELLREEENKISHSAKRTNINWNQFFIGVILLLIIGAIFSIFFR